MIWVFAVVVVGLVTVIVQLLMVYQKRAHDLHMRQQPIRAHIREHVRSMEESTQKIRQTAVQRFEELEFESGEFRKQSEELRQILRQLQEAVLGAVTRPEVSEVGEAAADSGEGDEKEKEKKKASTREMLTEAVHMRELMDNNISSMRRDLEIVRRSVDRIESRMQKRLGKHEVKEES